MRLKLAENIILMGGTVMTKGFMARLKEELLNKLKCPKYSNLKITKFKFHVAPAYENYIAWLGGKQLQLLHLIVTTIHLVLIIICF